MAELGGTKHISPYEVIVVAPTAVIPRSSPHNASELAVNVLNLDLLHVHAKCICRRSDTAYSGILIILDSITSWRRMRDQRLSG